jgi:hypothetical protein
VVDWLAGHDATEGAKVRADHARQHAKEAAREADAAECLLWSEQMEGFSGPAQPSPTIAQCLNGGYVARSQMSPVRDSGELAGRCHQAPARHPDLEIGSGAKMPVV